MSIEELISLIDAKSKDRTFIIGIDGRSAAGKSTLAAQLVKRLNAGIVHMDDFFLPPELRTVQRYNEPGGNFHYERFEAEVAEKLRADEDGFIYHIFDCSDMSCDKLSQPVCGSIKIIEGAYCMHPRLCDIYDLKIFCDISPEEQRKRILKRNGERGLKMFSEKWIPLEEKYISAFEVMEHADIVFVK